MELCPHRRFGALVVTGLAAVGPACLSTTSLAEPTAFLRVDPAPVTSPDDELAPSMLDEGAAGPVAGHDEGEVADPAEEDWVWTVTPYVWLLSLNGDATINGTQSEVDESFSDIFDNLSFVAEGRAEAWKGEWGWLLDLTYARLESDVDVGPLDGDSTADLILGLIGGGYRFVDQKPAHGHGALRVDGLFGVAYTYMSGELDIDGGPSSDGHEDWFDPVLGLRSAWDFNEKWAGMIEAFLGGFDLFNGSDLFTMFSVLVGRKLENGNTLLFGWRSMDIDYDGGSDLEADLRMTGPIVGYTFRF